MLTHGNFDMPYVNGLEKRNSFSVLPHQWRSGLLLWVIQHPTCDPLVINTANVTLQDKLLKKENGAIQKY